MSIALRVRTLIVALLAMSVLAGIMAPAPASASHGATLEFCSPRFANRSVHLYQVDRRVGASYTGASRRAGPSGCVTWNVTPGRSYMAISAAYSLHGSRYRAYSYTLSPRNELPVHTSYWWEMPTRS